PRSSLCLNMIVKNEEANLERCLRSIGPWISAYVIADTGSTDRTQQIIRDVMADLGVPGEVHSIPFDNFGQARNQALELAHGSTLAFDAILFADADMELVVEDEKVFCDLREPVLKIDQRSGTWRYDNVRILNRSMKRARYVGATHEYLDTGIADPKRLT